MSEYPSTSTVPQPPRQLKGFDKVALEPGQTRRVRVELNAHSLAYWDTNIHGWKIMPGSYRIMVDLPPATSECTAV